LIQLRSILLEVPSNQRIDAWLAPTKITQSRIFRAIRKNGKVWGIGLEESAIWQAVRHYAPKWATPTSSPRCPALARPHRLRHQAPLK
jgi:hypothetical protein